MGRVSRAARVRRIVLAALLVAAPGALAAAEPDVPVWLGPDGEPLPFATLDEVEDFLANADIVSNELIHTGTTLPRRLLLERDGVRARAIFKDVDAISRGVVRTRGRTLANFHDYHLFECAAYHLDRLLGLGRVPPSVPREVGGRSGTVSLWIEHTIMDSERRERGLEPPDPVRWEQQKRMMWIFDNLIGNVDSNLGNILIDRHWRIWFIDHTRCFVTDRKLVQPKAVTRCEAGLFHALENLDEDAVRRALSPFLNEPEIKGLLARRVAILDRLRERIATMGERAVLFELRPPGQEIGDW